MRTAVTEKPCFDLRVVGLERVLNGVRTDEQKFEFEGLTISTRVEELGVRGPYVSLDIFQDGVLIHHTWGDSVSVIMRDEKIAVSYNRTIGEADGTMHLVREWKWKVSWAPLDTTEHHRDSEC
jgi:hypothetical protein